MECLKGYLKFCSGALARILVLVGVGVRASSAMADVEHVKVAPVIDGCLDESVWQSTRWTGGFKRFNISRTGRTPLVETEFAILADAENLYVAARAYQPSMERLKTLPLRTIWCEEAVEFYFVPDGGVSEYYQFVMSYRAGKTAMYWAEAGQIRPDPYGGNWEMKTGDIPGGWCVEARIPLSAFYMTRNDRWQGTWRVNVARTSYVPDFSTSCWADGASYKDLKAFPKVSGFPLRRGNEDVWIKSVTAEPWGPKDGQIQGALKLSVYTKVTGWFDVETPFSEPKRLAIKNGDNELKVPALFPKNGRTVLPIKLTRTSDKSVSERTYPVLVDYRDIRVSFTSPGYRGNFYPGQASDVVAGSVFAAVKGELSLSLEGPGFPRREAKLPSGGGKFSFDTKGFQDGVATLSVRVNGRTFPFKVRKLAPLGAGRRVSWVENGRLIVDGKPVFRRNIYAEGYRGGKVFNARYAADDLHQTKDILGCGLLEPNRLIKGIEQKEATKDGEPSKELMAKIDEVVDRALAAGSKGCYYYISDEPECRNISPIYLKHIYDRVAERDPYHVILTCTRAGERYIECADWFETHPYLNPHPDADGKRVYTNKIPLLGSFIDAFHPEKHPDKCIGSTPTCFAYDWGDYPTFDEYVLNAWCHLVRGAKTIYPYAYHDLGDRAALYEGTRYLFTSIEALEDVLLNARRETVVKASEYELAQWITDKGEKLIAAVNFTDAPQTFMAKGLSGSFREFRGTRRFSLQPSGIEFKLAPLETLVAATCDWDGGLPSLDEVRTKIATAEQERTGRDNQLLGRDLEIDVAGSVPVAHPRKLFDGVRDMHAWQDISRAKEKFCELTFKGFVPKVSEIIVWGSGLGDVSVEVPEGDGWRMVRTVPGPRGPYSLSCRLEKPCTPAKVRLGLGSSNFELYEIEFPKTTNKENAK